MKKLQLLIILILAAPALFAQDTFSIVAVDTVTGEVGSAGASCINNSIIISDLHPGVGVIHTQAYWTSANQAYAGSLMDQGYSPQEIIDSLQANDVQSNPAIRQYGVVDFYGSGSRAAAFTGNGCQDYKNHIVGPNYAIQGNILLGQEVLDSMEARFLNTQGTLADKLMAALQGANIPSADTRCFLKPALSSFIRVARPADTSGTYYLDLNVGSTPGSINPIDSLQTLFDQWKGGPTSMESIENHYHVRVGTVPGALLIYPDMQQIKDLQAEILDMKGRKIRSVLLEAEQVTIPFEGYAKGMYLLKVSNGMEVEGYKFVVE